MKRCPQCSALYEDATQFCLNDGQPLIEDAPPNDNLEEETVIHRDPIIVDFNQPNFPPETVAYQTAPPVNQPTIIIEKPRSTGKYLLFLMIGLLLGGGLVLGTLFVAGTLNRGNDSDNSNASRSRAEKVAVSNQNVVVPANGNAAPNNANAVAVNAVHEEKTGAADDEFNGRVITLNAYVRTAPSKNSAETAVLPKNDRLTIGERENPNSPWYKVTCEHGISGWMHGDTIEFTK